MSDDPPVPRPWTTAASGDGDETVTELSTRLKQLRAQRLDDEAQAAQLPTLLRGIALSRRERDAGRARCCPTSGRRWKRMWSDVEELVSITAQIAVRLHLRGGDETDPLVRRARRAVEQSQVALREFGEAVNEA